MLLVTNGAGVGVAGLGVTDAFGVCVGVGFGVGEGVGVGVAVTVEVGKRFVGILIFGFKNIITVIIAAIIKIGRIWIIPFCLIF